MHEAPTVHLEDLPPALRRERERQNAALQLAYNNLCDEETERRLAAVDLPAHIDRNALTKSQRRRIATFAPSTASPAPPATPPPTSLEDLPLLLTVEEVAGMLRLSPRTVYSLAAKGEVQGARYLGRTLRFSRDEVLAWIRDGQSRGRRRRP